MDNPEELIKQMRLAGCEAVRIGLESGSNRILKSMNKHFDVSYATSILKIFNKNEIQVLVNLMVGFPTETEDEFNETLEFITQNKKNIQSVISISPFFLLPDTVIANQYKKYNISLPHVHPPIYWSDDTGNTYEIRKKRAIKLFEHVQAAGIEIEKKNVNLFD